MNQQRPAEQRPAEQRPAEQTVEVSPAAVTGDADTVSIAEGRDLAVALRNVGDQPTARSGDSGAFAPLPGLASFGDPGAGYCADGVCVMPGDGE